MHANGGRRSSLNAGLEKKSRSSIVWFFYLFLAWILSCSISNFLVFLERESVLIFLCSCVFFLYRTRPETKPAKVRLKNRHSKLKLSRQSCNFWFGLLKKKSSYFSFAIWNKHSKTTNCTCRTRSCISF